MIRGKSVKSKDQTWWNSVSFGENTQDERDEHVERKRISRGNTYSKSVYSTTRSVQNSDFQKRSRYLLAFSSSSSSCPYFPLSLKLSLILSSCVASARIVLILASVGTNTFDIRTGICITRQCTQAYIDYQRWDRGTMKCNQRCWKSERASERGEATRPR